MRSTLPASARARVRTAVLAGSAVLYTLLAAHTPIAIFGAAAHDDALFLRLGRAIAAGDWLGPYDHLTLIKGPAYPVYLAIVSWSGLPLTIANALLHCAAAAVAGRVLARLSGSVSFGDVVALALLWMPAALSASMARVFRDAIYPDLVLLAVAALFFAWFVAASALARLLSGLAAGGLLGAVWLTREEGIWLAPAIAVAALAALPRLVRHPERRALRTWTAPVATVVGFAIPFLAFFLANLLHYGAWVGVEVKQADFLRAMAALKSVRVGADIPRVPVTRAARARLYEVSPAFAALRPVLDPPTGPAFQSGCRYYPETCGEIAGGWFLWAVRQAAHRAGRASSPAAAADYYRQLAEEIEAACADGRLACERAGPALMPRRTPAARKELPGLLRSAFARMSLHDFAEQPPRESTGEISGAAEFLNRPAARALPGDGPRVRLDGWYYKPDGSWFSARTRAADGTFSETILFRRASPDLADHLGVPGARSNRFVAEGPCEPGCALVFEGSSGGRVRLEVASGVGKGHYLKLGRGTLVIDHLELSDPRRPARPAELAAGAVGGLIRLCSWLLPPLFALGALALLVATVRALRARRLSPLLALALGCWLAVLARIALLVVISLTAFPGVALHYLPPATVLGLVGSACALRCLRRDDEPEGAGPVECS